MRLRSIPIARSCHIHFAEDSLSVNQFVLMLTSPSRTFIESTANFTPSQVSLNEVRERYTRDSHRQSRYKSNIELDEIKRYRFFNLLALLIIELKVYLILQEGGRNQQGATK